MSSNIELDHFEFSTKIRVRYAETDQMGYCYYGNYASYFEVARVEALRNKGILYKELEYFVARKEIRNHVSSTGALRRFIRNKN
jgi:acyl-CoA thioesterase FadM